MTGVLVNQAGQKLAWPGGGEPLALGGDGKVFRTAQGVLVREAGPGGVLVNGQRVKEQALKEGDVIQVGTQKYTYTASNASGGGRPTERKVNPAAPGKPATQRMATPAAPASTSTGRTTSRVMKPVAAPAPAPAPAPAARPATQRLSPPAAAKPGTVALKPGTQALKPGTQALKPGTQALKPGTQALKPGTQRVEKSKPATGRSRGGAPSTRGARHLPPRGPSGLAAMLPRSTKGKLIALGAILAIAGVAGTLALIGSTHDKPEEIKKALADDIAALNKLGPDEIIKQDDLVQRIVANEKYKMYGGAPYFQLAKQADAFKQARITYEKARDEVVPFQEKYAALQEKPEELSAALQGLHDEIDALSNRYGSTSYGDWLATTRNAIRKALENKGKDNWQANHMKLTAEVNRMISDGQFTKAQKALSDFGQKYQEHNKPDLAKELNELREKLARTSEAHAKRKISQADQLMAESKVTDAIKLLEEALPGLEGFPGADKVAEKIRDLKR